MVLSSKRSWVFRMRIFRLRLLSWVHAPLRSKTCTRIQYFTWVTLKMLRGWDVLVVWIFPTWVWQVSRIFVTEEVESLNSCEESGEGLNSCHAFKHLGYFKMRSVDDAGLSWLKILGDVQDSLSQCGCSRINKSQRNRLAWIIPTDVYPKRALLLWSYSYGDKRIIVKQMGRLRDFARSLKWRASSTSANMLLLYKCWILKTLKSKKSRKNLISDRW